MRDPEGHNQIQGAMSQFLVNAGLHKRITNEAWTKESKPFIKFIKNFVFLLAKDFLYIFGTTYFATFSPNTQQHVIISSKHPPLYFSSQAPGTPKQED